MKTQELTVKELQVINGGVDTSSSSGVGLTLSTDTLLTLDYSWSDGQGRSYHSKLEIGKDINIGTGAQGNNQQQ